MRFSRRRSTLAVLLLAAGFVASPTEAQDNDLTLRVQDAVGVPGGQIAIVLRSYASKPVGQGQLCMRARGIAPGGPLALAALEASMVFSDAGDAAVQSSADLTTDPQTVVISFESASATVNASDGPVAVMLMQLSEDLTPGQTFEINVDLENSSLIDDLGQPVDIVPRPGELTIKAPGDPLAVGAEAEDAVVGGIALLTFQTNEVAPIGLGQVGLRYDPAIAAGTPTVEMDPRHGQANFGTFFPEPGLVLVQFQSPDGSLNEVPGDLVEIHLPLSESVAPDTESPVFLDPLLTFLYDDLGQTLLLDLDSDLLLIEGRIAGAVSGLRVGKDTIGTLQLSWPGDCGTADRYAIYRGDLSVGYASLVQEPGACELTDTTASLPLGPGDADFFLVVPHTGGLEGSFGELPSGDPRAPASVTCHPVGETHQCAP